MKIFPLVQIGKLADEEVLSRNQENSDGEKESPIHREGDARPGGDGQVCHPEQTSLGNFEVHQHQSNQDHWNDQPVAPCRPNKLGIHSARPKGCGCDCQGNQKHGLNDKSACDQFAMIHRNHEKHERNAELRCIRVRYTPATRKLTRRSRRGFAMAMHRALTRRCPSQNVAMDSTPAISASSTKYTDNQEGVRCDPRRPAFRWRRRKRLHLAWSDQPEAKHKQHTAGAPGSSPMPRLHRVLVIVGPGETPLAVRSATRRSGSRGGPRVREPTRQPRPNIAADQARAAWGLVARCESISTTNTQATVTRSIKGNAMQQGDVIGVLHSLDGAVNFFIKIVSTLLEGLAKFVDMQRANGRGLLVILDFKVDNMHRLVVARPLLLQSLNDLLEHASFACQNHVEFILRILKPLWLLFDALVALEQPENTILTISTSQGISGGENIVLP
eukprot:m.247129 g.247129  ORF g.247129 m.247129 type:complete len:444 (+) comp54479_c0_seq20:676-2007(+)